MMIDPGRRLERRAEQFEELASTLEAGLEPDASLADAQLRAWPLPGESWTANLGASLPDLDPVDEAVLAAGEHQGALPAMLRRRAERHRERAATRRDLVRRLAYPGMLTLAVVTLWLWLEYLGIGSPRSFGVAWAVVVAGALSAAVLLHRRARSAPESTPQRWPWIGDLYADSGAIPYLESLSGLLGAGVRIDEAHGRALKTVPWAGLRTRLFAVGAALDRGEPFADALRQADCFDGETDRAFAVAERAGDLEATAGRLATRRNERLQRSIGSACRTTGNIAYLSAALLAIVTIVDFYAGIASLRMFR